MKKLVALFLAILTLTAVCIPGAMAVTKWQERYGTKDLYTNTTGSNIHTYVRHLQEDLNTYGDYDLDEDGYYGKYTKLAVISFQKSVGLNDDGWAGDNTKKALYNAVYGTNF